MAQPIVPLKQTTTTNQMYPSATNQMYPSATVTANEFLTVPSPENPVATIVTTHDLEMCANTLLDMLPKHIAEYAREMAYVYNRQPVWSLIAGHVLKAYENGDLQAPMLDPSWPRAWKDLPVDPNGSQAECEWRGGEKGTHTYIRRRYKQRACSQECGLELQKLADAATK